VLGCRVVTARVRLHRARRRLRGNSAPTASRAPTPSAARRRLRPRPSAIPRSAGGSCVGPLHVPGMRRPGMVTESRFRRQRYAPTVRGTLRAVRSDGGCGSP
jgi:hypothetical protein